VNELVEKSISLCANGHVLENTCNFTGILVEVDLDPNRPKVPCVPSQIEQVLLNLLQNAVHAMEDRQGADPPPRIIARTRAGVEKVRIEVQDNGPGMEPEVLKQAFDPFFTTKEPGKGTGLGLSVAYYIMTNHKGSLRVESLPGEGATFVLELPK
jgi:signal transduction histidine kinase